MAMTANEILEQAFIKDGDRYTTDKALYLTADGKVVEEGDTSARYVLAGAGGTLPAPLAKTLGLGAKPVAKVKAEEPVPKAEDKSGDVPTEEPAKTVVPPVDAKAVKPAENKAVAPKVADNK